MQIVITNAANRTLEVYHKGRDVLYRLSTDYRVYQVDAVVMLGCGGISVAPSHDWGIPRQTDFRAVRRVGSRDLSVFFFLSKYNSYYSMRGSRAGNLSGRSMA